MTLEDYAKDQLSHIYDRIASDQDSRSKIKSWCVTVWLATLATVSSDRFPHLGGARNILPFLPILLFWLMDGIYQVFLGARTVHASTIEEMLLGFAEMSPESLRDISLESSRGINRGCSRARQIACAFFETPTVVAFYTVLIVVTAIFYLVLAK